MLSDFGRQGEEQGVERLVMLEANLDDVSGEIMALLPQICLDAGALDAWLVPIIMKKGRPAHTLKALCKSEDAAQVQTAIFRHSTTLGVRSYPVDRVAAKREWEVVDTVWGEVRIKVGTVDGEKVNAAPEIDDCIRLSEQTGVPVKDIYARAMAVYLTRE